MSTKELVKELKDAAQAYYQGDSSLMTDEEYDDKVAYLQTLVDEDPKLMELEGVNEVLEGDVAAGSSIEGDEGIHHEVPMLSLAKANNMTAVKDWYEKIEANGSLGVRIQAKLDGLAISVKYKGGQGIEISTRGDGSVGEDMSYLFNHSEVKIVGLPNRLENSIDCELRGELLARDSQFNTFNEARKEATGEEFKNSRNGVVGVVKKAKGALGYNAELTFVVYSYIVGDKYRDINELVVNEPEVVNINEISKSEWLMSGETGSLVSGNDFNSLVDLLVRFGERRPLFDIPTDGAVIKPLNEADLYKKMGLTAHHPLAFIAYKYPGAKAEATVLDIELSVGKTGKLTPTAVITPTDIAGVVIQRVTCHNIPWLMTKGIKVGDKVMITRANDVIPAITTVVEDNGGPSITVPTHCPVCSSKLVIKSEAAGPFRLYDLYCDNKKCPSRIYYNMRVAMSRQGFDIDGLNNLSLKALCDSGKLQTAADLFKLTESDLSELVIGETDKGNPRKFGKVRAVKTLALIEKAKTSTPEFKILNSLSFDGMGPNSFKLLLNKLGSIDNILTATYQSLMEIPGFGETKANNLIENQGYAREVYANMQASGVVPYVKSVPQQSSNGKTFAISGKVPDDFRNRQEFVDYMTQAGWTFDSSVKKTTDIVFGNSKDSSSKIKKAIKLGLKIVDPANYKSI